MRSARTLALMSKLCVLVFELLLEKRGERENFYLEHVHFLIFPQFFPRESER